MVPFKGGGLMFQIVRPIFLVALLLPFLAVRNLSAEDKGPSVGVFRELLEKSCNPCTLKTRGGVQAPSSSPTN